MSTQKMLMLIDESAFKFDNPDRNDKADAWFIAFLKDARDLFEIIVVAHNSPSTLKTKINHIDFSRAFKQGSKIDQSFLIMDVRTWKEIGHDHIDVLITEQDLPENSPSHDLKISSNSTYGPNRFNYFMETYEDNRMFSGAASAMRVIKQQILEHDTETRQLLTMLYGDPDRVWNKIIQNKSVKKLRDIFSPIAKARWDNETEEQKLLKKLHGYFGFIVRKYWNPAPENKIDLNLSGYKTSILEAFRDCNIGNHYPRRDIEPETNRGEIEQRFDETYTERKKIPIRAEHVSLVENALKTIDEIVKSEPIISLQ